MLRDIGNTHPLSAQCIRDHIAALEAEVAQVRDAALEEAAVTIECGCGLDTCRQNLGPERIRAMKPKPAQERPVAECGNVGEDGLCDHPDNPTPECHAGACPLVETASEENGLLPKKRRREHEYGEETRGFFGSTVAKCVRPGCNAHRLKTRGGRTTLFRQAPWDVATDEPGPCEVGS